jgi:hypothetical protein
VHRCSALVTMDGMGLIVPCRIALMTARTTGFATMGLAIATTNGRVLIVRPSRTPARTIVLATVFAQTN